MSLSHPEHLVAHFSHVTTMHGAILSTWLAICYKRRWPVAMLPAKNVIMVHVCSSAWEVTLYQCTHGLKYHNSYTCLLQLSKLFWNVNAQQIETIFPTNTTLPRSVQSAHRQTCMIHWAFVNSQWKCIANKDESQCSQNQVYDQLQPYG